MADKFLNLTGLSYLWSKITGALNLKADKTELPSEATDNDLGLVKTNINKSITLNANGQLEVGGRLGQFPDGGVFYPDTIEPTEVKASTFLMSDGAKYLSLGPRTFGIMAGVNLTCKSATAGTTQYRLSNTQNNRFVCFANKGGRIAIDQTDATENGTALMTDISFANGDPIRAYFGPTESSNDIIITVDRTVNPSASTTKLRMYGTSTSSDVIIVGQGNGASGGKAISLGQACHAGGNQCIAFGNSTLSLANNSVAFGHTHLVDKQFCFSAGQGHDFTNGSNGAGAVGICSEISSDTAFAVGNGIYNGNGNITRSNALEVTKDGGIVLKSTGGIKSKITVNDNGDLIINGSQPVYPTKTSDLTNDGDGTYPFATTNDIPSEPTKTSDLTNDGDGTYPFATTNDIPSNIPTKTSDLTNDGDGTSAFATTTGVTNAINALDVTISGAGAGKTLSALSETNGKISATFQDISITKSQVSDFPSKMTPTSHTHGKITNAGDITTNVAIASGDRLVINDESASQLNNSSITFGTSTTTFLSNKGTWATPSGAFKGIDTDSQLASYTSAFTYTANQDAYAIGTLQKGSDEMVVTLNGKTINQSTYGVASTSTYTFITVPLKNGDILKVTNTTCNVKVYKIK